MPDLPTTLLIGVVALAAAVVLVLLFITRVEVVADCEVCGEGKVPYRPPRITECDHCGTPHLSNPDGSLEPLENEGEKA